MKLCIPVSAGAEAAVKDELSALGFAHAPVIGGRAVVEGSWEDVARLNVRLRAAERVLIELSEFPARSFDELYEGVSRIAWEEYLSAHAHVLLDGKCVRSTLMAVKAAGGVVKKAIVERLRGAYGVRTLDERGERAIVGVSIVEDCVSITLDTSGEGLHKRGYRVLSYEAPLRETIAAAILERSFFRAGKPFADLFCGSGTIPIEAAMLAQNIAPGMGRSFDFVHWKCAPKWALARAKEEARDLEKRGTSHEIFAGDLSPKAIETARFHARRAGVEGQINFACRDMRAFTSHERYGVIVSNPPYGERLEHGGDLFSLYRDFSRVFRSLLDWSCYFVTSYPQAERAFGGRAAKRKKIMNAQLSCGVYAYFGAPPREG